jgi:hypothetical protein
MRAIAEALEGLAFSTELLLDASREEMIGAIRPPQRIVRGR